VALRADTRQAVSKVRTGRADRERRGKPVVAIGPVRARDYEGDEDPGEGDERPAVQMVVRYGCEALSRGRRDMSASLAPALYALWPASGPSSEPLRSYRCTVHV
jgi:hypothetical protein